MNLVKIFKKRHFIQRTLADGCFCNELYAQVLSFTLQGKLKVLPKVILIAQTGLLIPNKLYKLLDMQSILIGKLLIIREKILHPFYVTGLFLYPLKKTRGFLIFSGGTERNQRHDMRLKTRVKLLRQIVTLNHYNYSS